MTKLFVALDTPEERRIEMWLNELDGIDGDFGYKLNLDFLTREVRDGIRTTRDVFADIKMWNGKRTMLDTCLNVWNMGACMTNAYVFAGTDTLSQMVRELRGRIKLFGVGILTHYDDVYCKYHFGRTLSEEMRILTELAVRSNLDGMIVPGTCLDAVSDIEIPKLVPAVRPTSRASGYHERDDQKQTITITEAITGGADYLVCGTPITKSESPIDALKQILREIEAC